MIYRFAPGRGQQLLLIGEHWKSVAGRTRGARPSRIASRLRLSDVYDAVATLHGSTSKEDRRKIQRAMRAIEKERCC